MNIARLKKVGMFALALMLVLALGACGDGDRGTNVPVVAPAPAQIEAVLGQTYSLDTWDVTVDGIRFVNRVDVIEANSYFAARSGSFLVEVHMTATNTGDETDTFMPPYTMASPAPEGSVRTNIRFDESLVQRLVLRGGAAVSEWSIANTEAEPGETIDGYFLFEVSNEAQEDTEVRFIFQLFQNEERLVYDLRDLPEPEPEPEIELIPYEIGDMAVFEQFEITVTGFEITERIETSTFYFVPRDEDMLFAVVHLTVDNTGDEREQFLRTLIRANDARATLVHENGETFDALNLTASRSLLGTRIDPDETFEGFLVFEIDAETAYAGELGLLIDNGARGSIVLFQVR